MAARACFRCGRAIDALDILFTGLVCQHCGADNTLRDAPERELAKLARRDARARQELIRRFNAFEDEEWDDGQAAETSAAPRRTRRIAPRED